MDDFCIGASVESSSVPCLGAVSTISNLDTARSEWQEINIKKLCSAMREAYQKWNSQESQEDSEKVKVHASGYDHANVGKQLKELLND